MARAISRPLFFPALYFMVIISYVYLSSDLIKAHRCNKFRSIISLNINSCYYLSIVLMSAFIKISFGIHYIVGSFIVGLVLPYEGGFAVGIIKRIEDLIKRNKNSRKQIMDIYDTKSNLGCCSLRRQFTS
ncbi:15571_t:CDS:2, partial [Racocetra persica]